MKTTRALLRAGALALGLLAAGQAIAADGFIARDGGGTPVYLLGHSIGMTGQYQNKLPLTGLADSAGNDFGTQANPVRFGPGLVVATPVHTTVAILQGGTAATLPANPLRRGGWCYLPASQNAVVSYSLTGTAGTAAGTQDGELTPTGSLGFVQNGLLLTQAAISFNSTASGVVIDCLELQ